MYSLLNLSGDSQGCLDLVIANVYPDGLVCPWLLHSSVLVREKYLWCSSCRRKWSLKRQFGFGFSKLSWRQILALIICWQGKHAPGDIQIATGLSYPTLQRWLERLRRKLPDGKAAALAGELEIDDSFLGHQKHGNQAIVSGVLERQTGAIRLAVIPDVAQDSIEGFLDRYAEVGSLIYADAHASHVGLEDVGYGLVLCNHDRGHFGPTNRIENVWSCLDRFVIRTRDRFLKRFLPGVLQEFQARRNHPELFRDPFTLLKVWLFRFSGQNPFVNC
ncbi:transposase [Candidatus Saccharibacteria bacterium]|nr:transposase [Candidatus Saccharibacteria bacterium]